MAGDPLLQQKWRGRAQEWRRLAALTNDGTVLGQMSRCAGSMKTGTKVPSTNLRRCVVCGYVGVQSIGGGYPPLHDERPPATLVDRVADAIMLTHGSGLDWRACARAAIEQVAQHLTTEMHADG
jgi:hypothetical protein